MARDYLPLRIYRGTSAQNDAYTGPEGEITLDTTTHQLRTHDGVTEGGHALALDEAVVHSTGDESVGGVKTFSDGVKVPTQAQSDSSTNAASTAYVKEAVLGQAGGMVASVAKGTANTLTVTNGDGSSYSVVTQDTTYSEATASTPGLLSAVDKTKLDSVNPGAEANPGPATETDDGLMSAEDKAKLDSIDTNHLVTGVKGNSESAYRTGDVNITKAHIGLGNVDNTADADKHVALADKATADGAGNNIVNTYATKTDLESLRTGMVEIVAALPATGVEGKIYMVPNAGSSPTTYTNYAWENNSWVQLGVSTLDLTPYSKKTETVASVTASGTTVTVTKADGTSTTFNTPDSDTTYDVFKAASASEAGTEGLVPAPAAGKQAEFLRGDGTWGTPTNTDTLVTQNVSTTNDFYPVLMVATANASANLGAKTTIFANKVQVNPATGNITAATFTGTLKGKADSATTADSTSGNAETATKLAESKTIALSGAMTGSVGFDGSENVTIATELVASGVTAGSYGPTANDTPAFGASFSVPQVTVNAKGIVTSASTKTITLPANPDTHYTARLYAGASNSAGNVATANGATHLILVEEGTVRDRRKISGTGLAEVTSDASGNITINVDAQTIPTTAESAKKLETARTIAISGAVTGTATFFDGTENITIPTTGLDVSKANAGVLPVKRGGTGSSTQNWVDLTSNQEVNGVKTFNSLLIGKSNIDLVGARTKGDSVSSLSYASGYILMLDSRGTTAGTKSYVSEIAPVVNVNGDATLRFNVYKWDADSASAVEFGFVNSSSGNYAYCPTPSSKTENSTKIATTAWVRIATGDTALNAATATKLATARTVSLTTDATGSASFDGSNNATIAVTLANSGATAGSYGPSSNSTLRYSGTFIVPQVTVDAKGRVTSIVARTLTMPAASSVMTGATVSAAGAAGLVPAPSAGDNEKVLCGDGTWKDISEVVDIKVMPYLNVDKSSLELTVGNSGTVTFSTNSDGSVTVSSGSTSVAKATISGGVVTITAVGSGTTAITISVAATSTYYATNTTISIVVSAIQSLENTSWADISAIGQAGTGANYWDIGDTKSVSLSGTVGTLSLSGTYSVFIIDFNYRNSNGVYFQGFKTTSGVDVCLVDSSYNLSKTDGTKIFNMNHWGNYNYGGWKGCDLRYDILGSTDKAPSGYGSAVTTSRVGYDATSTAKTSPVSNTLMAALPSALRTVLSPWTVYTDNKGNGSNVAANVISSIDYLPLLAEWEIFGVRNYANEYEKDSQTQMVYYANGNSRVKNKHSDASATALWWERSPYYHHAGTFCNVYTSGSAGNNTAQSSIGLAPAFKV